MTRVVRIAAAGLVASLLVLVGGWAAQRLTVGADDRDARARIERIVRSSFETLTSDVRVRANAIGDAEAVGRSAAGDADASRRLFAAAAQAVDGDDSADLALTVYARDGRALAWAGRTTDIPTERLQGNEAWFFAQDAFGLRLAYVKPVVTSAGRLGTVAVERSLPTVDATAPPPTQTSAATVSVNAFQFPTTIAPVSLRLPFEDPGTPSTAGSFTVAAPGGGTLVTAAVDGGDIVRARDRWRRFTFSMALTTVAITVLLLVGPALDRRTAARTQYDHGIAVLFVAAALVTARVVLRAASFADWSTAPLVSSAAYASPLAPPLLASPFDFLATALVAGALVALGLQTLEAWRVRGWPTRRSIDSSLRLLAYVVTQLLAGGAVGTVMLAHERLLGDTIDHTTLDLLHFSLHPWSGARIALQAGLLAGDATVVALGILLFRAAGVRWRVRQRDWQLRLLTWICWIGPLVVYQSLRGLTLDEQLPLLAALGVVVVLSTYATRLKARFRHGSQAFRLLLLAAGLIIPAIAFYPALFQLAWKAKSQLIETRYAQEARNQRQAVLTQLTDTLGEVDAFPGLDDLIAVPAAPASAEALTDRAYQVWQGTALGQDFVTSSVELYRADGSLVSRFAFNLPDDLTALPQSDETSCEWNVFGEVAPFFADKRVVFHAGRAICGPGGRRLGSITVHAMVDYENLPFISSENPYLELLRASDPFRGEGVSGGDVEFAFYGWSRTPLFSSRETAWQLDDTVFERLLSDPQRAPFWTTLRRGDDRYDIYLLNDRGGIYALGFPVVSVLGHLVNLAELTVLVVGAYILLLLTNALFARLVRRRLTTRGLLREIRASFYRKLFVYFVLAVSFPVFALAAVTRYYIAEQLRGNVEEEAIRTASTARRVVEDLAAPRIAQQGVVLDDNLLVWVSRLIDQDVNIFTGPRLTATSERNLFASSLLPTRTPADAYRAIELGNEAVAVTREHIGVLEYLVAASRLRFRQQDAIMTVPLASRQQDIDAQIDALDRRVLLGALLFLMAGAGLGYSMAERISDPVNRLTRATRRIARGDLDARVAMTSSDELRRLVTDFNTMAADLQRQRVELERTHRLEAWAEMARQVAHEIKNPLTPIQLNAEHLRRVHADRGEPLSPILEQCVETILTQVRLLRQIASEFSSFASSPTARLSRVDVPELLREVIDPYRTGLEGRIEIQTSVPAVLPPVSVDRTLIARSLTNIVENALHAMPGAGTLRVEASAGDHAVYVRISDTGAGMDAEALARAFEPYFSTKATGTGLGLPIAKRNVELVGGAIAVHTEREKGTTVELTLPVATEEAQSA